MRVVRGLHAIRPRKCLCLAMGVFDGVHIGHREIISRAVAAAAEMGGAAAVLTFEPHPEAVLRARGAPQLLTTTSEKLALLRALGVKVAVVAPFDTDLAGMPAETFVEDVVVRRLGACCLFVGEGWRFGSGARGTTDLLQRMGRTYGFRVGIIPRIAAGGAPVSSTRIRRLLARGKVGPAAELLGRPYELSGEVVTGAGRGRRLGWPTANVLPPAEKLVPGDGVYACWAGLRRLGPAVTNIGVRPTFELRGGRTIEVHLLGRPRVDLVGRNLRVAFGERLRAERRFANAEDLLAQMERDAARAQKVLSGLQGPADVL